MKFKYCLFVILFPYEKWNVKVFEVSCCSFLSSCRIVTKESRVNAVLEDALERVLINLHSIQKNLQFWQSRAEVFVFSVLLIVIICVFLFQMCSFWRYIVMIVLVCFVCLFVFCVQRSDTRKAYFMVFERGPRAFIDETVKLLRGRAAAQGSSLQNLCQSASDYIDERVTVLNSLRFSLAIFLAQVCFCDCTAHCFFVFES